MIKLLIVYSVVVTLALAWALFQLSLDRTMLKMVEEFRETDRKHYRGWENIWFQQLKHMSESIPKSTIRTATAKTIRSRNKPKK